MKGKSSYFLPVIILFVLLTLFFALGGSMLDKWKASQPVLLLGNALVFGVAWLSFYMGSRSLSNPNPQAFIRAVYGSFIIKFFVCALAAMIYILVFKKDLNKPALFSVMGLFIVYTFMEVRALTRLLKEHRNG